ncbi:MAG TPA: NUDIX domain-containing protein [Candidatus Dormibacteraeota bacterium]
MRALVVDRSDRLVLFHATLPDREPWWFAPGGGVDPGESDAAAIARELHEEIGLVVDAASLPPPVWTRDYIFRWNDVDERHLERFFLVRIDEHIVDISGLGADEAGIVREYRWWTPNELQVTAERFSPGHLPQLLLPLLDGRLPEEPVALGE